MAFLSLHSSLCTERAVVRWEQSGMAQTSDPGAGQKPCFGSNACMIIHVFMQI